MRKLFGLSALSLPTIFLAYWMYPFIYGRQLSMSPTQAQFGELITLAVWIAIAGVVLVVGVLVSRHGK